MNRNLFPLLVGMIFLLAGCTMAPQYIRPDAPIPGTWPSGRAYQKAEGDATGKKLAEITWQEFFIDPQLQKLITFALANNRDLRIAALNIERAQALYQIQRADLFPTVAAFGSSLNQKTPKNVPIAGQPPVTYR